MDVLTNKQSTSVDYISRYNGVPTYFNTSTKRELTGLTKNLLRNTSSVLHKVKPTDNWASLALTYYNNPTYWWVIANFNGVCDAFIRPIDRFTTIKVPAIANISFGVLR